MKPTQTLLDEKARRAVWLGVNAIYEPVRRSLGPHASRALIYRTYHRGPRITDDGVTISEVQEPKDPHVNLAANAFKEMCKRTVEKVGDGTTTTAVIGGKLYNDIHQKLEGGSTFMGSTESSAADMGRAILRSAETVKDAVKASSTKIETLDDLEHVATISVKDATLGKVVAKIAWEVGADGHVDVVEGYKGEIETEVMQGMRFPGKPAAKAFVNEPKRYEMVAADCPVLLTNHAIDNPADISLPLRRFNEKDGITKIVIIAPSFSTQVLIEMTKACKANYFIFPVAAPGLRLEQFEDLAVYFGARFVDKNKGQRVQTVGALDLGFVGKLIVKDTDMREDAVATNGGGTRTNGDTTEVMKRIETLKEQLLEQKDDKFKKLLERRIAAMASAVGVIRVGDSTQAEALYWKLKIEDCVYACKAALRGGYVKGGGLCLKEIAETLPEDDLLRPALMHPYELIQASAPGGKLEIGPDVIDPTEAIYWAVEHASQVAAQLITVTVLTPEMDPTDVGDATMAAARMLGEVVVATKRYLGLLQENQEEMERDRLLGLTANEKVMLDTG